MMHIEVTRVHSYLHTEEWAFWFDDRTVCLVLDSYRVYRKETARHKARVAGSYSRLLSRNDTLTLDDVPWDAEIESEAKAELFKRITVVKK